MTVQFFTILQDYVRVVRSYVESIRNFVEKAFSFYKSKGAFTCRQVVWADKWTVPMDKLILFKTRMNETSLNQSDVGSE